MVCTPSPSGARATFCARTRANARDHFPWHLAYSRRQVDATGAVLVHDAGDHSTRRHQAGVPPRYGEKGPRGRNPAAPMQPHREGLSLHLRASLRLCCRQGLHRRFSAPSRSCATHGRAGVARHMDLVLHTYRPNPDGRPARRLALRGKSPATRDQSPSTERHQAPPTCPTLAGRALLWRWNPDHTGPPVAQHRPVAEPV